MTTAPKKTWRRRLRRGLLIIACLLVLVRLSLSLVIPAILNRAARAYGLQCTYEKLDLSLFATDMGIWRLQVAPLGGGGEFARAQYLRADISALDLLIGRLHIYLAEADSVQATLVRQADGSMPILDRILAASAVPAAQTSVGSPGLSVHSLAAPLRVDALRLHNIEANFQDLCVAPALNTHVRLNVELSDLAGTDRPTSFDVEVMADPVLDYLHCEGQGRSTANLLQADVKLMVRGFHPKPIGGYLNALGLAPVADTIAMHGAVHLEMHVLPPAPTAVPNTPPEVSAALDVHDVALSTDDHEALTLDKMTIQVDRLDGGLAECAKVSVDGVRCHTGRSAAGNPLVAGLEMIGTARRPTPLAPHHQAPQAVSAARGFHWRLGELSLAHLLVDFHDSAVSPAADLAFAIDQITIHNLDNQVTSAQAAVDLTGRLRAPGIARSIVIEGSVKPFVTPIDFQARVVADGIAPDALRPYLNALGLESDFTNGRATADLHASWSHDDNDAWTGNVSLKNVELTDRGPLFTFDGIDIAGIAYDPTQEDFHVDTIAVHGPQIRADRDAAGALHVLGVRTRLAGPTAAPVMAPVPTPPATTTQLAKSEPARFPLVSVDHFTWSGITCAWSDHAVTPPVSVVLGDVHIDVDHLRIAPDAHPATQPAALHASIKIPGLLGDIHADGTLTAAQSSLALDLRVAGSGLCTDRLNPYLHTIQPTWRNGTFALHAALAAHVAGDGWLADLDIDGVQLSDGPRELAGLDLLRIHGAMLHPESTDLDSITLVHPRLSAQREADGRLVIAGVRLLPTTALAADADQTDTPRAASPCVLSLQHLSIDGATLSWADHATPTPVATTLTTALSLDNLYLAQPGGPARFSLTTSITGAVDNLIVRGTLTPDPAHPGIALHVAGRGLRGGVLAPYFPPGLELAPHDGRLGIDFTAKADPSPQGGWRGTLGGAFDWRDGANVLLHADGFSVIINRFDLPAHLVSISTVSLASLDAHVDQLPDGATRIAGLTLRSVPPQPPPPAPAPAPEGPAQEDLTRALAQARQTPPLVTLDHLDLNLHRLLINRPSGGSLAIADVRLTNPAPLSFLGAHPSTQPSKLQITGRVEDVADAVSVDIEAAPFLRDPTLHVDVDVSGIHGARLVKLAHLSGVDGSTLTDGRLSVSLFAALQLARRDPLDFDLSHGATAHLSMHNLAFREHHDGPVVAGLQRISCDALQILPDGHGLHAKIIEVNQPIFHAHRDAQGIHILGCLVAPSAPPSASPAPTPVADSVPAATALPDSVITIDHIYLSGLDVGFDDTTISLPLHMALSDMDAQVKDITTLGLVENHPIQFNALINSGPFTADRPDDLFGQFTLAGKIGMYPHPNGWIKLKLSSFDLSSLHDEAKKNGVDLNSGALDVTVDARIAGPGDIDARTQFVLTDLTIHEQPNGPIARRMAWPVGLDAVVKMLQDADGSISMNVDVPLEHGKLSMTKIEGSVLNAVNGVILNALAAAPIKAVQGIGSLFGLDLFHHPFKPPPPLALNFPPGGTALEGADLDQLRAFAHDVARDSQLEVTGRFDVGEEDMALLAARANPTRPQCLILIAQWQQRQQDLREQRDSLAGQARAQLATQSQDTAAPISARVAEVDRALAHADDALDGLRDLLAHNAQRGAARRTHDAAIELMRERRHAVRDIFLSVGPKSIAERLHLIFAPYQAQPQRSDGRVVLTQVKARSD